MMWSFGSKIVIATKAMLPNCHFTVITSVSQPRATAFSYAYSVQKNVNSTI